MSSSVCFGRIALIVGVRGNLAQIQISVPMQRGASGGPVLDQSGHVIGVVVSTLDALKPAENVTQLTVRVRCLRAATSAGVTVPTQK